MYTILGSGYGLYGYLPALVFLKKEKVVLPEKFRPKILARKELLALIEKIQWVETTEIALKLSKNVIIAVPPQAQGNLVKSCLEYPNLKRFYLEKPVAPTPSESKQLVDSILAAHRKVFVGYSLLHTPWASLIDLSKYANEDLELRWKFMAHHYRTGARNWKSNHHLGGGALRFYGIHIVALLHHYGYRDALKSKFYTIGDGELYKWKAQIKGQGLPDIYVEVDSKCDDQEFSITNCHGESLVSLSEPFEGGKATGGFDTRINVVASMISPKSDFEEESALLDIYGSITLWAAIEKITKI